MKFITGYDYDSELHSFENGIFFDDESLALQSMEEESNINTIVRRFGLTGELPSDVRMPISGDFTNIPDFHTAMNLVRSAQEEFLRVPADIRARFSNDPAAFMSFLEDDSNRDEARKLGLLREPDAPPAPIDVRVIPESASGG